MRTHKKTSNQIQRIKNVENLYNLYYKLSKEERIITEKDISNIRDNLLSDDVD
jgi:hypothetical protein